VPLLEGLDGVEKMSKSKNNYVGITEPPAVMFSKLMSIPDDLMFRYYELLTDKTVSEIAQLRLAHPKETKMELARLIVSDFHSREDAERAAGEWVRVVSQGSVPAELEEYLVTEAGLRMDKLLVRCGLAASGSEAQRKMKEGALEVDGARVSELVVLEFPGSYVLRLGKKWKKVQG
jgi:tyrosyl-tRNA synthetase